MKKYIPEHKVQRMRNLATKKFGNKTKIQIGYGNSTEDHVEGDIWEEKGKKWTIKNGITQSVTKLDNIRKSVLMPLVCPKCETKVMKGSLDKIFWRLYKECSDCKISEETYLKITDREKYLEYEKDVMQKNLKTYIKDMQMLADDFISATNRKGYITEAGKIEDWSKQNTEELSNKIKTKIDNMEKDLTKKFDNVHKEQS